MVTRKEAEKEALELAGFKKSEIVILSKFSPVPFADEVLKHVKIVYDKNKTLWRYDKKEGIWKNNASQYLRTLIRLNLLGDEQQKKNYVEEVISYLKDICYDESFEINNNPFLLGFRNGVFDLNSGDFMKFNPSHSLTNKIDIEIDEEINSCPNIDRFFGECVGEEYKDILYELCAYCLFKRYPYPKVFFIYGPANTGKSKFIQLLETFLGSENCCSIEPQDIQKDPYATAQMLFKMANIASDINYDALDNINQVKKITGEDSIKIRNMYREPYNSRITAKQIFSTNKLPIVKEKTRAWYKRVYIIEFSNVVSKEKEDPFLIKKLTSPEEMKGLAYRCLQHLIALNENNFVFNHDIDIPEIEKIYEQLSNPIMLFADQTCVKESGEFVYQWEFKERLKTWLQGNHFPPISRTEVNNYMKEHYTESNRPSFNGEKVYRVWSGLRWKHQNEAFNRFNHFNQVMKKAYRGEGRFQNPVKSVKLVK